LRENIYPQTIGGNLPSRRQVLPIPRDYPFQTNMPTTTQRIAKNTLMLYFRQILIMLVSLYTVRVVLNTLGAEDYGIYNVVAGITLLFGFLNGTLSGATSRFFSYELGNGDNQRLKQTFASARTINLILGGIILVIGETIGLWFIYNKINIPAARLHTASIVYHTSLVCIILQIMLIPYTAIIISHERMTAFAMFDILNVILKLISVYCLTLVNYDKLLIYGLFLLLINVLISICYRIYCFKHFVETKSLLCFKSEFIKPMILFSGIDLYGNASVVMRTHGINVLLNIFFGPVINAASSVAGQANAAIGSFSSNIITAFKPQIIISYARNDKQQMIKKICYASKYGFLMLFLIGFPVFLEMPVILRLWLKEVPNYTVIFCRFSLLFTVFASFSTSLVTGLHAIGKIRNCNLINGTLYLSVVPIAYFAFKNGSSPVLPFVLNIIFVIFGALCNLLTLRYYVKEFSIKKFVKNVLIPCLCTTICASVSPLILFFTVDDGFFRLFLVFGSAIVSMAFFTFIIGMEKDAKLLVIQKAKTLLKRGK
jgi:O-antigen/teichoic acid export membrane protein